jgi:hypothetical protein
MLHRPVALILAACLAAGPARAEGLDLIGRFDWDTQLIVGLSGIEMDDDGLGFTAVSDQGWWLQGALSRDGEVITGVEIERLEPILGSNGLPAAARRVGDWSDAEGLAIGPDGRAWVSFERWAHVWWYEAPFSKANHIPDHETFKDYADNWQLEAIAISPEGTVYAFPERPLAEGFPIYRLAPGNLWEIDSYLPESEVFGIVGADFDADGTLYLLERKLVVGLWWQNRVRRVRLDTGADTIIWTGERGEYGNLEGISVWSDDKGRRLTLISDNNGSSATPTEFVEFRLTD